MDINLKQTALQNLAKTAGEVAETALRKELDKIIPVFQNETDYDQIANQLKLLDVISYRVHENAVDVVRGLLERLECLELTYQEIPGYTVEQLSEFQNNSTLMVDALEILEHIRYHDPANILDLLFEYSCHHEENISKQAKHGIEILAKYDLDIFYGDGKNWPGLGLKPQEKVLEKIGTFDESQKQKYFFAIIIACKEILSPTISGTSSTYKTFTWRTGATPALDGVKEIRKKTLDVLENLYAISSDTGQKKAVLNAMEAATRTPHMGDYGDDVQAMIVGNSIAVAEFMKNIAISDDMQIMQKIEHDAYWLLYHKGEFDKTLHNILLEIRDALYADEEFQIFRILIGFDSIFHDWERGGIESEDFESERKYRETEAQKLAEAIRTDNYDEWKDRIIRYASIESNDMATFPYFGKFLEYFGKTSPELALQLLQETSDKLENFIPAILHGVVETEYKKSVYSLIEEWCNAGKYLFYLARFFEFSEEVHVDLLKKLLGRATASNDLNTLNQIISSVSAQYNEENKHLIKEFFIPTLEILTAHKNSGWLFGFWFRKQRGDILANMEVAGYKAILDNLFWSHEIDYHAEEILCLIAKRSPELVVQFFCNRLLKENDEEDKVRYDAIPYSFHKLSEPLSQHPVQVTDAVLDIFDGDFGLFIYGGARFLKNIFPNFPPEFQQKLLEVIQSNEEKELLFVMAILRNYYGDPIIHDFCKEIVKILPEDSKLINEIISILQSTGVVSGEYGFVEAYKKKTEEIQPWLQDENTKVQEFAQNYVAGLEKRIEYEQKRADEDITLRKREYGAGED